MPSLDVSYSLHELDLRGDVCARMQRTRRRVGLCLNLIADTNILRRLCRFLGCTGERGFGFVIKEHGGNAHHNVPISIYFPVRLGYYAVVALHILNDGKEMPATQN